VGSQTPRLSFTDCTSFVIMRELGLKLAFTADRHFHRAGGGIRPIFEQHGSKLEFRI
jgi:predicted nucleic acid-binding protein